jgi:hypothetical protein
MIIVGLRFSGTPGSLDLIAMVTTSGTFSGRFQAKAPKWVTKLPLEAAELGAKSGNSLWCMPPYEYSESGRILLTGRLLGSRFRTQPTTSDC